MYRRTMSIFEMVQMVPLVLSSIIILLSKFDGAEAECSKFQEGVMSISFNDVCFYGFKEEMTFSEAAEMCRSKGTRIPIMDSAVKQEMVKNMIGFYVPEFWISLQYKNEKWVWVNDLREYPMTQPRWATQELTGEGKIYATASDGTWNKKRADASVTFMCEDDASPPTITAASGRDTVTTCTAIRSLGNVIQSVNIKAESLIECAVICTEDSECTYLQFYQEPGTCHGYKSHFNDGSISFSCPQGCFHCQ